MRHQIKGKKLNRTKSHRDAMMANMVMSLLDHRTVKTTDAKAKELRRLADRIISTARENTVAARRQVAKTVRDRKIVKKLFDEIAPQFKDRESGFTRVMKIGYRRGDSALISMVELMTKKPKSEKEKSKKAKSKSAGK